MRRKWRWLLLFGGIMTVVVAIYVRSRPLVFNESLWEHAHCIKIAGLTLVGYADENDGKYPYHPKGYGNALLLLPENCYFTLTGPGYDAAAFHAAKKNGRDLPELECGRVYVQGLTNSSNGKIALLFDKVPTPGGDHCHFPFRLWAPLGREVWFVGCYSEFIAENSWPEFAEKQIELLVKEGITRKEAERLYEQ